MPSPRPASLLDRKQAAEPPLIHLSTDYIRAKEYFEAIVSSTSDAICTTDVRGRIIYFSPGAEAMFGATSAAMMGRSAWELYADKRAEGERIMKRLRREGSVRSHETAVDTFDGRRIHISLSASLLRDRAGKVIGTLGISKDITDRVELERRLRELSITDKLTGLLNQRCFIDRLAQEVQRARRQRQKLSLVLIDLDRFKQVNDSLGHMAGDQLLKALAAILKRGLREHVDSVYRYGGDEFIILLPGQSGPKATQVAERLLRQGVETLGANARFSYGIATFPSFGSASELLQAADRRMYAMKQSRRNE